MSLTNLSKFQEQCIRATTQEIEKKLINLYVQSIPGSFWGDHNFGVSSLVKSYLGKDNLECVSNRELAWMCRVGLLPTVVGKDYVRFYFLKEWYKDRNINIWDDRKIKLYIKKYQRQKAFEKAQQEKNKVKRIVVRGEKEEIGKQIY